MSHLNSTIYTILVLSSHSLYCSASHTPTMVKKTERNYAIKQDSLKKICV